MTKIEMSNNNDNNNNYNDRFFCICLLLFSDKTFGGQLGIFKSLAHVLFMLITPGGFHLCKYITAYHKAMIIIVI